MIFNETLFLHKSSQQFIMQWFGNTAYLSVFEDLCTMHAFEVKKSHTINTIDNENDNNDRHIFIDFILIMTFKLIIKSEKSRLFN